MRHAVALSCRTEWVWGPESSIFDIGVTGIICFEMVKLVQSGVCSVVFLLAPPEVKGLGRGRVNLLFFPQELVDVGYLPGKELLTVLRLDVLFTFAQSGWSHTVLTSHATK